MECNYDIVELRKLLNKQLGNWWNISFSEEYDALLETILEKLEYNFSKVNSKYYEKNGHILFSVQNSVQYSIFLYVLSNSLQKNGDIQMASYVYYLNKIMNSVEWFYAIELPDIFCAEHPIGTVLGRANYGDYLYVYQGVTVGGNRTNGTLCYPTLGERVTLYANSTILGNSHIGNYVIVAAGTYIKDEDIPDYCVVFGTSPNLIIKRKSKAEIIEMTKHLWK